MGKDAGSAVVAAVECENPPYVTRGWNSQECHSGAKNGGAVPSQKAPAIMGMHWLRGSLPGEEKSWAVSFLDRLFLASDDDRHESHEYGFWRYDRHYRWQNGVMLMYHATPAGDALTKGRIAVEVPGHVLDTLDMYDVMLLCAALAAHGWQTSRMDLYFDDFERIVTPRQIESLVREVSLYGNQPIREDWTGFMDLTPNHEYRRGKGCVREEIAFGRRGKMGSGKYLRIYDKGLESGGVNTAIRYELELSDKRAQKAFDMLLGTLCENWNPEVTASLIGAIIGGCIDFKQRNGRKNVKRCPRYAFWQRIIDKIGAESVLRPKDPEKSIERGERWVHKQVAGTIQMLRIAYGTEVFLPMLFDLAEAEDRLTPKHRQAIELYLQKKRGETGLNIAEVRTMCDKSSIELEGDSEHEMPELQDAGVAG